MMVIKTCVFCSRPVMVKQRGGRWFWWLMPPSPPPRHDPKGPEGATCYRIFSQRMGV